MALYDFGRFLLFLLLLFFDFIGALPLLEASGSEGKFEIVGALIKDGLGLMLGVDDADRMVVALMVGAEVRRVVTVDL